MDTTAALLLALVALLVGTALGAYLVWRLAPAPLRGAHSTADVSSDQLLRPVNEALDRVERQLAETERYRLQSHGQIQEQVRAMNDTSQLLRSETSSLVQALRAPQTRGRWGEVQLRRVVELAGMVEHCDFSEQLTVGVSDDRQRPDLVVHLAGGKNVVVDAKVPFAAYLEANAAADETTASTRADAHARHLRTHVDQLADREYWEALAPSPEFVVLFVPAEPFLSAALDRDPTLLEHAFSKQVVIATPNTLIALLRTVAYTWRQDALADNAQAVLAAGRELHQRLGVLGGHLAKVGSSLESSVKAYNQAVGSLESRVLVTSRKFHDLRVVDEAVSAPDTIDLAPRMPQAVELTDSSDTHSDTDDRTAAG
ncbi:MAG: DNA recombination protein RmuC [Actinomycetes bacterium]